MEMTMTLTDLERWSIQRADLEYELELLESGEVTAADGQGFDSTEEAIHEITASIAKLDGIISRATAN